MASRQFQALHRQLLHSFDGTFCATCIMVGTWRIQVTFPENELGFRANEEEGGGEVGEEAHRRLFQKMITNLTTCIKLVDDYIKK